MYTPGKGAAGAVLGTTAAVTLPSVLPQTGMNLAVEIAIIAVATLVVWAAIYGIMSKVRG